MAFGNQGAYMAVPLSLRQRSLASGAKSVKSPGILHFIMAQNIKIAVVCADTKVACGRRIPLAVNLVYLKFAAAKNKPKGPLVGSVSGMALDANFAHRASARQKSAAAHELRPTFSV
jgi:hypothetical protein